MSRGLRIIGLLVVSSMLFASCKKTDRARRSSLEGKKTEYLLKQMQTNAFHFDTFQAKADVKVKQKDQQNSFKANIRIKKDSLIWISITPLLGIEMARVLITEDSVKVINRLNREYFIGDYSYVNKRFNVELEFDIIQAMLIGNAVDFEENEKLQFATDKQFYYLGNLKKRKAKKADDKPGRIGKEDEELISLWLDPENFRIAKLLYSDLSADRFLLGEYSNFSEVNDQLLAKELSFDFQSKKPATINIDYSRVSLNESIKFSFNISSKYEQVFY